MLGSHICSLVVHAMTTPVPATATQLRSLPRHSGHTVSDGCSSFWHSSHRGSRSSPSAPPVQNGALGPPRAGSGRTTSVLTRESCQGLVAKTPRARPDKGSGQRSGDRLGLEVLLETFEAVLSADATCLVAAERRLGAVPDTAVDGHGAGADSTGDRERAFL